MERKYVVICNRHHGISGALLFWGCQTNDNEKRSFGGYTNDFNKCEKYTLEELKNSEYNFPIYGKDFNHDNWSQAPDIVIEIKRLRRLDVKPMLIYRR